MAWGHPLYPTRWPCDPGPIPSVLCHFPRLQRGTNNEKPRHAAVGPKWNTVRMLRERWWHPAMRPQHPREMQDVLEFGLGGSTS